MLLKIPLSQFQDLHKQNAFLKGAPFVCLNASVRVHQVVVITKLSEIVK